MVSVSSRLRIAVALTSLFVLGFLPLSGQQHPQRRHFLVNQDVVNLAKAGFTEHDIIDTVRAAPSRFDVSVAALVRLSAQGISERVVQAMLASHSSIGPAAQEVHK
jgi:hypothetical protein